MAMSFPSDPVASPQQQGNVNNDNNHSSDSNSSSSSASPTSSNDPTLSMIPPNDLVTGQAVPAFGPKRKPTRRANTAERRATHNAVERQRRETLNGRFLDLANLLPNLSQIRRPSKSSIVNSSIAHIQASRRHRMIASRELRALKYESDALRRELNEWRDRTGLPRVEEPTRGDGFGMVLAGELEAISGISIEEEDEDGDEGLGLAMSGLPIQHQPTQQHQQQMASYGGSGGYMDESDDDVLASYQQQQRQQTAAVNPPQIRHAMHHAPQHQIHPQQQQQNTMIADLEDPRMAPKNVAASNPFAHNSPCYPTVNTHSLYPNTTWGQSPAAYTPPHLYTPPASSHGLLTPALTSGTNSHSGSPVGGLSLNVGAAIAGGSPASSSSSLSGGGGGSPISLVPSHGPLANGRNGCLSMGGHNPGDQSPPYEYHSAQSEYTGGSRSTGMLSTPFFVPSQHHQVHGEMSFPQAVGVGGSFHGALMMMI